MYPFRLLADLRPSVPWSIYSAPVYRAGARPIEHRFAIHWDEDDDERVLAAVQSLYYTSPRTFRFCHAFGECKGTFTVWHLNFAHELEPALSVALDGLAALGGDSWPTELINNYLPSTEATPEVRAALALAVAKPSATVSATLNLLAPPDSDTAQVTAMITGFKPEFRPGIDTNLAALHKLFHLGSFEKPDREWLSRSCA